MNKGKEFSTIMDVGLKRKKWSCVKLSRELVEAGYPLSPRTLQRYRVGEMQPSIPNAKGILHVLEIDASNEELAEMLEYARKSRAGNDEQINYIRQGVRLRVASLSKHDYDRDTIMMMIKRRIKEVLPPGSQNMNQYLTLLIREDLENKILTKDTKSTNNEEEHK